VTVKDSERHRAIVQVKIVTGTTAMVSLPEANIG